VFRPQIVIRHPIAQDVIHTHQDTVADGQHRLLPAAALPQPGILRAQVRPPRARLPSRTRSRRA
jgi:hypothetical protein